MSTEKWQSFNNWKKNTSNRWVGDYLLEQQHFKCAICEIQILWPNISPVIAENDQCRFATWDHIIPLSKGGEDVPSNLQLLCRPCNSRKGSKLPIDSRATLNNDNDNEKVLKNLLVGPVDNVDNSAFNRAERVEKTADNLVKTFGSEDSYKFYCKVAYELSDQHIERIRKTALTGRNPGGLFNWLCNQEMYRKSNPHFNSYFPKAK